MASHANKTTSLADELSSQVESILTIVRVAQDQGKKVFARNPMCHEDILTDRWPENLSDQAVFIAELADFAAKLRKLRGEISLAEMQPILEDLFGEKPARSAVKDYVQRVGTDVRSTGSRFMPGKAAILAAIAGCNTAAPNNARSAPSHKFFGDHPDDLPESG